MQIYHTPMYDHIFIQIYAGSIQKYIGTPVSRYKFSDVFWFPLMTILRGVYASRSNTQKIGALQVNF